MITRNDVVEASKMICGITGAVVGGMAGGFSTLAATIYAISYIPNIGRITPNEAYIAMNNVVIPATATATVLAAGTGYTIGERIGESLVPCVEDAAQLVSSISSDVGRAVKGLDTSRASQNMNAFFRNSSLEILDKDKTADEDLEIENRRCLDSM